MYRIGTCDACRFEDIEIKLYDQTFPKWRHWYCMVCASSMISTAHHYEGYREHRELFRTLGFIANTIIWTMKHSNPPWIKARGEKQ
jgi:hypothetical protein